MLRAVRVLTGAAKYCPLVFWKIQTNNNKMSGIHVCGLIDVTLHLEH